MIFCKSVCVLSLIALFSLELVQCVKIKVDQHMTDEEIFQTFRTTRENIPEYEVVEIRHNLYKRSNGNARLQFYAFDKNIDVYLNPTDGFLAGKYTPVWLASTDSSGQIKYKKLDELLVGKVAGYYIDNDLGAVLLNGRRISGVVADLSFAEVPATVVEVKKDEFNRLRSKREIELQQDASRTLTSSGYHIVYKSQAGLTNHKVQEVSRFFNESYGQKYKRSTEDYIFPTLLITTSLKDGDKKTDNPAYYYDAIMYQLAFWNAVDLRYRHLSDPKVRLRIAGIIIGRDRAATPYIQNNLKPDGVFLDTALSDMNKFWKAKSKEAEFPSIAYDAIVTIIDHKLYYIDSKTNKQQEALGMAYTESLCNIQGSYLPLSILTDKGGFDGILVAAHEIGHIFGASHDGDRNNKCNGDDGYIMAPSALNSDNALKWSSCSAKQLSRMFRKRRIDCVDTPDTHWDPEGEIQRFLPGSIVNAHKQCQARGYAWACDPVPEICSHLKCYYTGWDVFVHGFNCKNSYPAAEGTKCGDNHRCVDGKCEEYIEELNKTN